MFRERVPEWQEHYMEQLTKKYIELLSWVFTFSSGMDFLHGE